MLECWHAKPSVRDRLGKEDVEHVVTIAIAHQGAMPFDAEGALTHGVSMPIMISLGAQKTSGTS